MRRKWGVGCILWRKRQYFEVNLGETGRTNVVMATTTSVLNRVERGENVKSMLQRESPSDRKTKITLGLPDRQGNYKKFEEKVFNLLIFSGEMSTNLTPD